MKAECLISLPGFVVAASDGKPLKYSFRVYNLTTSFYFASDTVAEMSKWISKIGYAAISYSLTSESVDEAFFSETDSSDQEADYINDQETYSTTIPRNQSRQILRNNSTVSAASNASSSHVPVVASVRIPDRRFAKPVPTPVVQQEEESQEPENYVKLAYPPPSPMGRKPIPPPSPESPRKYVELAQMDEPNSEKPPLPAKGINALRAKREPPTPLPRVSKLKDKFEAPEPPPLNKRVTPDVKTIDQLLNSSDVLLNPVYHHVIPKDQGTRLGVAVDPEIFSKVASPESGTMTMLDREYNRLFGDKSPLELNRCVPPRTSTDIVSNIYGITSDIHVNTETSSSSLPRNCPFSNNIRSHSPTSDKSCSSSSGISSSGHSISVGSSTNRLEFQSRNNEPSNDDVFTNQELNTDAKSRKPVKSNSFRLLSSPKLLKKFSTPKYHKGRRQEKKDVKSPDETKSTSGFFKVSRSLASIDPNKGLRRSNSINRSCSDSVIRTFAVRSHSAERAAGSKCRSSDLQISPETHGKPTMGIAMIRKKRESSVSNDKSIIESVLARFPSESTPTEPRSNSPDTEEEWSNIVKGLEKVGMSIDKSNASSKELIGEEVSNIVGSLRSYQSSLKVSSIVTRLFKSFIEIIHCRIETRRKK